jgi:hypothetical protein
MMKKKKKNCLITRRQKYAPPPPPSSLDNDDPTTVVTAGDHWICKSGPESYHRQEGHVLGKWIYMALESTVNKYWQAIWPTVVSGELHAAAVKVSTKYAKQQKKQAAYVIIVYTTQRRMDEGGVPNTTNFFDMVRLATRRINKQPTIITLVTTRRIKQQNSRR